MSYLRVSTENGLTYFFFYGKGAKWGPKYSEALHIC